MSGQFASDEAQAVRAVSVQAVFHVLDDRQAQTVAAKMVDRAYEIANLPDCECDVDVNIERLQADVLTSSVELGGEIPPPARPSTL